MDTQRESYDKDWGLIEIKVRKLMKDLLDPVISKLKSSETTNFQLKESNNQLKHQFEELKFEFDSLALNIPKTETMNEMFVESLSKVNILEINLRKDNNAIENQIKILYNKLDNVGTQVNSLFNQIDLIRKDMKTSKNDFIHMKNVIQTEISEFARIIDHNSQKSNEDYQKQGLSVIKYEKKLGFLSDSLSELEVTTKINHSKIMESLDFNMARLDEQKNSNSSLEKSLRKAENEISAFYGYLKSEIHTFSEEIEKKISDSAASVLSQQDLIVYNWLEHILVEPRYKKKLSEFMKKRKNRTAMQENSINSANTTKKYNFNIISQKSLKSFEEDIEKINEIENTLQYIQIPENHRESFSNLSLLSQRSIKIVSSSMPTVQFLATKIKINTKTSKSIQDSVSRSLELYRTLKSSDSVEKQQEENLYYNKSRDIRENTIKNIDYMADIEKLDKKYDNIIKDLQNQLEIYSQEVLELAHIIKENKEIYDQEVFGLKNSFENLSQIFDNKLKDLNVDINSYKQEINTNISTINTSITYSIKPWVQKTLVETQNALMQTISSLDQTTSEKISKITKTHLELDKLLKQSTDEFNLYVSTKKREIVDLSCEIKKIQKNSNSNSANISILIKTIDRIDENIKIFKEINEMLYCLLKQDENDKKTLSLLGYKSNKDTVEPKQSTRSPVKIDKSCLNCLANATQVVPAFKAACLAYSPSPVQFKNSLLSRFELLDMQEDLLQKLNLGPCAVENGIDGLRQRSLTPELPKIKLIIR